MKGNARTITAGQQFELGGIIVKHIPQITEGMSFEVAEKLLKGKTAADIVRKALMPNASRWIIFIDRAAPFNPEKFIAKGWSIWRGSANGNGLSGEEEQNKLSLGLAELDISKIQLETCLKPGGSSIKGDEKLKRLKKSGYIRLDAKIFQTFWENQHLIPESWKEEVNGNTRYIFFDGTILRSPYGRRCALCLCWLGGEWRWGCYWLGNDWHAGDPSAVLASI
jgi:hypothetical protein